MKNSLGVMGLTIGMNLSACEKSTEPQAPSHHIGPITSAPSRLTRPFSEAECSPLVSEFLQMVHTQHSIGSRQGARDWPSHLMENELDRQCNISDAEFGRIRALMRSVATARLNQLNLACPRIARVVSNESTVFDDPLPPIVCSNDIDGLTQKLESCVGIAAASCSQRVEVQCQHTECGPGVHRNHCTYEPSRLTDLVDSMHIVQVECRTHARQATQ